MNSSMSCGVRFNDDIDWLKHLGGRAALMGRKVYDEILDEGIERRRRGFGSIGDQDNFAAGPSGFAGAVGLGGF
jgi:hypothetical protein